MQTLEKKLFQETQSLKNQFIHKMKEWANNHYDKVLERKNWNEGQWCRFLGIKPVIKNNEKESFPSGFYNSFYYKEYDKNKQEIRKLNNMGKEKYVNKSIEKAEEHYENSIYKLANRLRKKGIDENNITIKTSHMGVNIESIISDGKKTIKAYTIVAGGEIQKPHYRYLVK